VQSLEKSLILKFVMEFHLLFLFENKRNKKKDMKKKKSNKKKNWTKEEKEKKFEESD